MSAEPHSFFVASRPPGALASITSDASDHKSRRKAGLLRNKKGFTLLETMVAATIFAMAALGIYAILFRAYQLSAIARYRDDARAVLETFADQFQRLDSSRTIYILSATGLPISDAGNYTYRSSTKDLVDSSNHVMYTGVTPATYTRELFVTTPTSGTGHGLGLWSDDGSGNLQGKYWDSTSTHEVISSNQDSTAFPNQTDTTPLSLTLGGTTDTNSLNAVAATVVRVVSQIDGDPTSATYGQVITGSSPAAGQLLSATFTITYSVFNRQIQQSLTVSRLSETN